jgi:hypothetical protein
LCNDFFGEKKSAWQTDGIEKKMTLTDLPEELLIAIFVAMGNHPAGFILRFVARRVCRAFRELPLALPCVAATTTLHLPRLLGYMRHQAVELVRAYDFGSARIVSMSIDSAIYRFVFRGTNTIISTQAPCSLLKLRPYRCSLRYSCEEDRFAWFCSDRWVTCAAADLRDRMSFALNADVKRELARSAVREIRPTTPLDAAGRRPCRTRPRPACAVDANPFFRAVCDALPTNGTCELDLEGLGLYASSVTLPAFDASKLTRLSIKNTRLHGNAVCYVAGLTHLSFLDLSHSVVFTRVSLAALAELVHTWHGTSSVLSKLIMDGDRDAVVGKGISPLDVSSMFAPLVDAMEGPDHLDRVSSCSLADTRVYLSCDILLPMEWDARIVFKTVYRPLVVRMRAATETSTAAAVETETSTAAAAAGTETAAAAAPPLTVEVSVPAVVGTVHTHYTDAKRELDRGMFGWFDYACRNCGTVWTKNSVTISFRQTVVSECLKGKRSCASRDECARMLAGEKFITDKHCVGNGGKDLSPRPADVLRYEQEGLLVGVNPLSGLYELFQPHPTRVGIKVAV